jgi:hypothetical protein
MDAAQTKISPTHIYKAQINIRFLHSYWKFCRAVNE